MCRFLLAQSQQPFNPLDVLTPFILKTKKSKSLDGDWQGDGFGVAWSTDNKTWHIKKSLKPIWEEQFLFTTIPHIRRLAVHARSASFPQHKGVIAYNQPYIAEKYVFVFNGLVKKVSLSIPGDIGAEKIWYLVKKALSENDPQDALEKTKKLLERNAQEIVALNMGIITFDTLYSLCYFTKHPEYYQLHYGKHNNITFTCSEKIF